MWIGLGICALVAIALLVIGAVALWLDARRDAINFERAAAADAARRGEPPPVTPEGLRLVRSAASVLDVGDSPVDMREALCRGMLARDRGVSDEQGARAMIVELQSQPPSAWKNVRLIRVALAAHRALYISHWHAWTVVRQAAIEIQAQHASFEDIGLKYLAARSEWSGGEDQSPFYENISEMREREWDGVAYALDLASA